jgi:hypothetical protein
MPNLVVVKLGSDGAVQFCNAAGSVNAAPSTHMPGTGPDGHAAACDEGLQKPGPG